MEQEVGNRSETLRISHHQAQKMSPNDGRSQMINALQVKTEFVTTNHNGRLRP